MVGFIWGLMSLFLYFGLFDYMYAPHIELTPLGWLLFIPTLPSWLTWVIVNAFKTVDFRIDLYVLVIAPIPPMLIGAVIGGILGLVVDKTRKVK